MKKVSLDISAFIGLVILVFAFFKHDMWLFALGAVLYLRPMND